MKEADKTLMARALKIMAAFAVAAAGSLPFLLWPETIKRLSAAGYIGLTAACFLTNATVFLPASGIAFTVSAASVLNPLWCAAAGGIGTALGELVGYYCGRIGKKAVEETQLLCRIRKFLDKYGIMAVLLFAFLPLPLFDLVGVTAGAARMPLPKYFLSCAAGKILKMMMYVFLVQNYLNL